MFYLSYSGRKSYLICPKRYEFAYILRTKIVREARNTFLGTVVGKVFEWFYSHYYWKTSDPVATCLSAVSVAISETFKEEKFDCSSEPDFRTNLEREAMSLIPGGLEVIRANGLLTPLSRAEVDLSIECSSEEHGMTLKMGGRADFIHGKSRDDLWILDGKASKHRDKFVDPEQLIWYAVQHYIKYHVFPTRLGFIFWSFPVDPLSWIEFTPADVRASVDVTFNTMKKINLKQFEAAPTLECYRCDYQSHCPDGKQWIANRKLEGSRISDSIFDPEIVT